MERNLGKRLISAVLALVMVLGYVPATALASEEDGLCEHHTQHTQACGYAPGVAAQDCGHGHTEECHQSVTACVHTHDDCGYAEEKTESPCTFSCEECAQEAAADVASGTCGDDLTWVLTDDGTLTISGTGAMANYDFNNAAPWQDYRDSITSVTIESGVTSIGECAFYKCGSLTSITIPESVTSIGPDAFRDCSSLTSVTIPEGVTSIGYGTFEECSSLTSITIPESVTSIRDYAFSKCSSLTSITIPESVTSIGNSAFSYCSSLTDITIPESVTSIGEYAFSVCSSLTSITIPESVTSIREGAFEECSSLTSITIPESVTRIDHYAFSGCSSLTGITIPEGVTKISKRTFYNCTGLTTISFKGNAPTIGSDAFYEVTATAYYPADDATWTEEVMQDYGGTITWTPYSTASEVASGTCGDNLTWVLSDDDILTISGTGAMTDYDREASVPWYKFRSQIQSVVMSESVTSIGHYAFYSCSSLTSITIPESVTSIGHYAFHSCSSLTDITIPESVTSIGSRAFDSCSSLTDITIPEGVTSIGFGMFFYCSSLTSITIPESVTSIGDKAFYSCSSLTSITIPESVTSIGNSTFFNCSSLTSITIPDNVASIDEFAFANCTNLTSITIPSKVTSIGNSAFSNCTSLQGIWVSEGNPYYCSSEDGVLFNKEKTTLLQCPGGMKGTYCIPDGVTSIGESAFYNCSSLTSITIPESVTSIGDSAFSGCSSLTDITIPEGVTSIEEGAFSYCSKLQGIWVSEGNPNYCSSEDGVLFNKEKTTLLQCPCGMKGTYCNPDGVTSIGERAFAGCRSLTSITIPESVTSIGSGAFSGCRSLTDITIPESVTSIGDYTFYSCSSLTDITIPEGVTSIGSEMFYGCSSLTSITIPKGVTSIGRYAFENCSSLTTISFKGNAPTIESNAFLNVTVTAYYPADDATWTEEVMQDYGGTITWKAYCAEHVSVIRDAVEATCTEDGYTGDEVCEICGELISKGSVISAAGHSFGEWVVTTEPTCTEKGTETRTCTDCGVTETREVDPLGHNIVDGKCTICGEILALKAPELLSIFSRQQTSCKATWTIVAGADGYELWRTTDPDDDESWSRAKTIKDGTQDRYTNQGLEVGITYYYKVRAYIGEEEASREFSEFSEVKYMPAAVVFDEPYSNSTFRIRLRWEKIGGADGYQIWRLKDDGTWGIVKTLGDKGNTLTDDQGATVAYSNTGLEAGKQYTYKMRAFAIPEEGVKVFGAYSDEFTVAVMPEAPEVSVTSPKAGRAEATWEAVNGAAGYQVWMAESESGPYKIIKSVTDGSTAYTKYDLTSGKTYYFKVRAYVEVDGKKTFGDYSQIAAVAVQ